MEQGYSALDNLRRSVAGCSMVSQAPAFSAVHVSRRAFSEMLSFSLLSQVANTSNGLFEPTSKLLISHFFGLNVLGIYELAFKTLYLSRNVIIAGVTATLPAMTAQYNKNVLDVVPTYNSAVRLTGIATAVMIIVLIAASPVISYLWIGQVSAEYTTDMAILAFGVFLTRSALLLSIYAWSLERCATT